jgi:hypothetical protein
LGLLGRLNSRFLNAFIEFVPAHRQLRRMGIKKNASAVALAGSLALLCSLPMSASGANLGDWRTGVTTNGKEFFAYTQNDNGQAFGEWCSVDSGSCTWMIGMSFACDKDFAYPVLANSDAEAESLSMNCSGTIEDTDLSRYAFTDFKSVKSLLKDAHVVGFAIPMQSDQFRVIRFSLDGCSDAIAAMEASATAAYQRQKNAAAATRDVKMQADSGRGASATTAALGPIAAKTTH